MNCQGVDIVVKLRDFVHAEMMLQWLTDPTLEVEFESFMGKWITTKAPEWHPTTLYRFKQKTIRIGEFDVPEPLCIAPKIGTRYWVPVMDFNVLTGPLTWDNCVYDQTALKKGMAHSVRRNAEIHAKALLSLTEVKYE